MKSGMIDFEEYFPYQVRGEYYVVRHEITSFLLDPKKGYDDVMSFLQQEMPHLRSIRAKLGKTDMFYQKVSSYVVEACLQKIIPAVNDEQSRLDSLGLKYEAPNYIHFRTLRILLKNLGLHTRLWIKWIWSICLSTNDTCHAVTPCG